MVTYLNFLCWTDNTYCPILGSHEGVEFKFVCFPYRLANTNEIFWKESEKYIIYSLLHMTQGHDSLILRKNQKSAYMNHISFLLQIVLYCPELGGKSVKKELSSYMSLHLCFYICVFDKKMLLKIFFLLCHFTAHKKAHLIFSKNFALF